MDGIKRTPVHQEHHAGATIVIDLVCIPGAVPYYDASITKDVVTISPGAYATLDMAKEYARRYAVRMTE